MRVLFVGAHPDDIELGAGGLSMRLQLIGHELLWLVLTDDQCAAPVRRAETLAAAAHLGLSPSDVLFAGFRDGFLRADRDSVSSVRTLLQNRGFRPDVVVTHTTVDQHNDHHEASRLSHAAFREAAILNYSVHTSWRPDKFAPRIFVELQGCLGNAKNRAISEYASQASRITRNSKIDYERSLARAGALSEAEGFEVEFGTSSDDVRREVFSWSDSVFHQLWLPIVTLDRLDLLYEAYLQAGERIDWPTVDENAGRDALREAFADQWPPKSPLHEQYSDGPNARDCLLQGSVVLVGGAVSNPLVREVYNRLRMVRWIIEYDMPRQEPAYLCQRDRSLILRPEFRSGRLQYDVAVISKIPNPFAQSGFLMNVAGATGFGTRSGLETLASPASTDVGRHLCRPEVLEVAYRISAPDRTIEVIETRERD